MIVVVMGMSKSGTTLVAKTLHESGIDMHPGKTGNYNESKYEDPEIIKILLQMFNTDRLQSLFLPEKIIFNNDIKKQIKKLIANRRGDWGFKQPWITLCYPELKKVLPPHIAVGIKRTFPGLISHWTKRGKDVNQSRLKTAYDVYNMMMTVYHIPVLNFEDFLRDGPGELEKIIDRKLKDVRV